MDYLRSIKKGMKTMVVTRWNSIYFMINSFLKLTDEKYRSIYDEFYKAATTKPKKSTVEQTLTVTEKEREVLGELKTILEELHIKTQVLQSNKVNFLSVIVAISNFTYRLTSFELTHYNEVRDALKGNIKTRFTYATQDDMSTFAALLDPNYGLTWMSQREQAIWLAKFEAMLTDAEDRLNLSGLKTQRALEREADNQPEPLRYFNLYRETKSNFEMINKVKSFFAHVETEQTIHYARMAAAAANDKAPRIASYMNTIDQLQFWAKLEKLPEFVLFAREARKFLAIPATSATVERVFSQTGFIVRPHRRCLGDKLCESTFFLKCISICWLIMTWS